MVVDGAQGGYGLDVSNSDIRATELILELVFDISEQTCLG